MSLSRTHRDPLILHQTLLDLAARLKIATATRDLGRQAEILDAIFHVLARVGLCESGDSQHLCPLVIHLALRAQRQPMSFHRESDTAQMSPKTEKRTEGIP